MMKFGKDYKEVAARVLGCNLSSFYNWDNQGRPIIKLLQTYFPNKEDLQEWLDQSKITKFELLKEQDATMHYAGIQYLNLFLERIGSIGDIINENFMDLYFNVLIYSKDNMKNQRVFKPFEIQKSSLIYLSKSNVFYQTPENEIIPKFEIAIELLSEFDCYTNQFLQSNIMQNFKSMLHIAESDSIETSSQIEASLHIILFHLYNIHQDKSQEEKRELLIEILETLFLSVTQKDQAGTPIMNLDNNVSLDTLLQKDFGLVQKNFDKILQAIAVA